MRSRLLVPLLAAALVLLALGLAIVRKVAASPDSDVLVGLVSAAPLLVLGLVMAACALLLRLRRRP